MANFSSAVKGLIPKSTGGRMALGAGGALGVAAGVAGYRRRQAYQQQAAFDRLPASQRIPSMQQAANGISPEFGSYIQQRINAGNLPTL
jgi:hypothetical protein